MPQMSPLMWAPLFISFSTLLLFAMVKIYFKPSPITSGSESQMNNNNTLNMDNQWMW